MNRFSFAVCLGMALLLLGFEHPALGERVGESGAPTFFTPFLEAHRNTLAAVRRRMIGRFAEHRSSRRPGHLHSGIDLAGAAGETVYSIGKGEVMRVYWAFPNETVLVRHRWPSGEIRYSAYTHLTEIRVKRGDQVDERTPLGRLFNGAEMKKVPYSRIHVHLEIRISMADDGLASSASMTRAALDRFFEDPLVFFRRVMR